MWRRDEQRERREGERMKEVNVLAGEGSAFVMTFFLPKSQAGSADAHFTEKPTCKLKIDL